MKVVNLTNENFESTIMSCEMVLIDFWAPWCAPCRNFSPIYEAVAAKYPHLIFGKVNVDECGELVRDFNVQSIPMLLIFRKEFLVFAGDGLMPAVALEELIAQGLNLSMTEMETASRGNKEVK